MNEKGSLVYTDQFSHLPSGFSKRVSLLLSHPGDSSDSLARSLDALEELCQETFEICP